MSWLHCCTLTSTSDSMYQKYFMQLSHDDHSNLQVGPLICGFQNPQCAVLSHLMLFTSSNHMGAQWCPQEVIWGTVVIVLQPAIHLLINCTCRKKSGCWNNQILDFLVTFLLIVSSVGKAGEGLFSALMQLSGQDYQSSDCTSQLTLPPRVDPSLKALQLTEALRAVLEGQGSDEEQDLLRKEVSTDTAHVILKWLEREEVSCVTHIGR